MIRLAEKTDMPVITRIYERAKEYMKANGNGSQWGGSYPQNELLEEDIEYRRLFVFEEDGLVHGVFAFIIGEDETYRNIESGEWLSNAPYGTIHRIAGDGTVKGLLGSVIDHCSRIIPHLRIDTHENNLIVQHIVLKKGFKKCGIIYVEDGTPRIAFERI